MQTEQTLIILKPDAVKRQLVGRILSFFEDAGLKIVRLEMLIASKEILNQHYPDTDDWYTAVGNKTLETNQKYGIDSMEKFGTADPIEVGKQIKSWLVDFMASGSVVVGIIEGTHAAEAVRKIVGSTIPLFAEAGTIRAMLSCDSPDIANEENRPIYNLIHASGDAEEAKKEIALWFGN